MVIPFSSVVNSSKSFRVRLLNIHHIKNLCEIIFHQKIVETVLFRLMIQLLLCTVVSWIFYGIISL